MEALTEILEQSEEVAKFYLREADCDESILEATAKHITLFAFAVISSTEGECPAAACGTLMEMLGIDMHAALHIGIDVGKYPTVVTQVAEEMLRQGKRQM